MWCVAGSPQWVYHSSFSAVAENRDDENVENESYRECSVRIKQCAKRGLECDPTERNEMQRLKNTVIISSLLCLCQPCCSLLYGKVPSVVFPLGFGTTFPLSPGSGGRWWWRPGLLVRVTGGLKQGPGGRQPWDCWGLVTDGRAGTQSPWAVPAVSSLLLSFLSHNTLSLLLHLSPLFLWIYFSDMAFSIIYHLIISPFTVLSFLFSLSWIHLFLFSSLVLFITVVDFYKSLSALSSVLVPDSFTFSLLFFFLTYESSFLSSVSNLLRCAHSRST